MLYRRCPAGLGLDVSLIELGNEFYLDRSDYIAAFPDGAAYGQACLAWIAAIRAAWPASRIAVVTTPSAGGGGTRAGQWNARLFSVLSSLPPASVDATMHEYPGSGVDCGECRLDAAAVSTMLLQTPSAVAAKVGAAVDALPAVVRR